MSEVKQESADQSIFSLILGYVGSVVWEAVCLPLTVSALIVFEVRRRRHERMATAKIETRVLGHMEAVRGESPGQLTASPDIQGRAGELASVTDSEYQLALSRTRKIAERISDSDRKKMDALVAGELRYASHLSANKKLKNRSVD